MIQLIRFREFEESTHGLIYIDNKFVCFTLEDLIKYDGYNKVPNKTRIPEGVYKLGDRKIGGFYERYTKEHSWHNGMIEIVKVPGFTDILFHKGNTAQNSSGCVLLGMGLSPRGELVDSAGAYKSFYEKVYPRVNSLQVSITDEMITL